MPYFVFSVRPFTPLEKLAEFDAFTLASNHAKTLRSALPTASNAKIKLMFAETQEMAEDLLCQIRQPGPSGDD